MTIYFVWSSMQVQRLEISRSAHRSFCLYFTSDNVQISLKKLLNRRMRELVKERGVRCDGRRTDEARRLLAILSLGISFCLSCGRLPPMAIYATVITREAFELWKL